MWGHDRRRFADRKQAGRALVDLVAPEVEGEDVVILALPRGGVPVAYEVATTLRAPLDVLLVRKLGVPWQPELAFGAIASGGIIVANDDVVRELGIGAEAIGGVVERERVELERRERLYRGGRSPLDVAGKTAVVVDDGIATGASVRAALRSLESRGAARRIVACAVAPIETVRDLRHDADAVLAVLTPSPFRAVGEWYEDFAPVSDDEVRDLLDRAASEAN